MKLCTIIHTWVDSIELLTLSIENKLEFSDHVLVCWSLHSNYGQYSEHLLRYSQDCMHPNVSFFQVEPKLSLKPQENERNKRNAALDHIRNKGFTHFLMCDTDEFYVASEVEYIKAHFDKWNTLTGTVCYTQVYFASPRLTIGLDTTLVPFIHKINSSICFMWNKSYPFAWIDGKIRIDPTRQLNITEEVDLFTEQIVCHHYSYVRKDIKMKIYNSTARTNIEKSTILRDLAIAKEGEMCNFYNKILVRTENLFNIPDFGDEK